MEEWITIFDNLPLLSLDKRTITPWSECEPKDRARREERVRELGCCPCCEDLDATILDAAAGRSTRIGDALPGLQLEAVQQAAEEGCQCCRLLCRIVDDFGLVFTFEGMDRPLELKVIVDSDRFRVSVRVERGFESSRWVDVSRRCEVQGGAWTALPLWTPITSDNLGDRSCLDMVGLWLRECLDTHEANHPTLPKLPSRVIEIVDEFMVKIVHANGERAHYFALSHHWGSDPRSQPTQTNQGNLEHHTEGIHSSTLTKTIRDAIELTYQLGYKYLWVDSLCIIQDDSDDWAQESSKMSEVFGGSTLTIFAATTLECFIRRKRSTCRPDDPWVFSWRHFDRQSYRYHHNHTKSGDEVEIIAQPIIEHSRVLTGRYDDEERHLFERGWVIQEWALSPRAVVFDHDELFWSCDHIIPHSRCECRTNSGSEKYSPFEIRRLFRGLKMKKELYESVWTNIITIFSRTSLTFQSDRLPALSGLVKAYAELRDSKLSDYVAGCWKPQLLPSLLWSTHPSALENQRDSRQHSEYVAPSWSWVSALGGIQWYNAPWEAHTKFVTSVDDVYCEPATSDPTGAVKSGYLVAYGPAFEREIDLMIEDCLEQLDVEAEMVVWKDFCSHAYIQLTKTVQGSTELTFLLISCRVDMLSEYFERGIIIAPSKTRPDAYERVGCFEARLGYCSDPKWKGIGVENVNLENFVERLRNGRVHETIRRRALLPLCTMERVTIV